MKKTFYYSLLFVTLSTLLVFLPSCKKAENYRDDISCARISKEMCDEVASFGEYSEYSEEDVRLLLRGTSLYDDFRIIYSSDANDINEIGVFHCPDEQSSKEFLSVVKDYISEQQENQKAFIASYAPREVPKLEAAEVKRYGNYVIYTILDENAKKEVFEEVKELLEN